jgi:hypothetical protein
MRDDTVERISLEAQDQHCVSRDSHGLREIEMIVDEVSTVTTVTGRSKAQRVRGRQFSLLIKCTELEREEPAEQKIPLPPLSRNRVLNKL